MHTRVSIPFLSKKMSIALTRSSRRAAVPVPPDLYEALTRINSLTSAYNAGVAAEYKAVAKALKDDEERIVAFWLERPALLDTEDFRHRYLLRMLFENCGLSHPIMKTFLDTVTSQERLMEMGVVSYVRGDNVHYRIRTGIHS
jgi:hypothetical protein